MTAELPLVAKAWYLVGVSYDRRTGHAQLYQESVLNRYNSLVGKVVPYDFASRVLQRFRFEPENKPDVPFLIAGARDEHALRGSFVNDLYVGKIDRPAICNRTLSQAEFDACRRGELPPADSVLAYWDTSKGYTANGVGNEVIDTGPHRLNATGVNHPVRAMTGWNWQGKDDCFRIDPSQFGGIEFHLDAVTDCGWKPTKWMTVPTGLKSGIYAMRLRIGPGTGIAEEYIVFVVRPAKPTAKLCFLVPTASYLAYANESLSFDAEIIQPMTGQPPVVTDLDVETYEHREYGLSTYDHYEDDAGVCFSSYLRPIINMRPKYRMSSMNITWQFPADLSIVAWIHHMGYDCDFITDEDLHREGFDLLRPYLCVITGMIPVNMCRNGCLMPRRIM